ncbi:MAG TPA: hypothetical protein ENI29_19615, partial [bacterium]|nr:hypothetical protein [bacterium]
FKFIDAHCHFFPPQIFKAIWDFFEKTDENGNIQGWPIKYKHPTEELVKILTDNNVRAFTTYNYAHKKGVATSINDWTYQFYKKHKNAIPFGCVWPEDKDRLEYTRKILDEFNFTGIKIQPLVQNFFPHDERMFGVYDLIVDRGKWITFHAGTAPYRNKYVGYRHFIKFLEKYPDINLIVAHMGAFEYKKFLKLLDKHENLYLDTAVIFIPDNVFPERVVKRTTPEELISYQDKILFGSDYPNIPHDYRQSTKGLLEFDLPRDFYEDIFFNNSKQLFNLSTI